MTRSSSASISSPAAISPTFFPRSPFPIGESTEIFPFARSASLCATNLYSIEAELLRLHPDFAEIREKEKKERYAKKYQSYLDGKQKAIEAGLSATTTTRPLLGNPYNNHVSNSEEEIEIYNYPGSDKQIKPPRAINRS